MPPQRYDLFLIRMRLRASYDYRPCIVLDAPNPDTCIVLVSSSDLFRQGYDFLIPSDHPDFPATGLKKTSFAIGDQIHEVSTTALEEKFRLGRLQGGLARDFNKWLG